MIAPREVARGRRRAGLVILVVLVVVTISATLASSVLIRVDAGTIESRGALRSAQSRAAAWSGVQAVMARLGEQRDDLLAGRAPVLPESWAFPVESPDGRIVFRVIPAPDGLPAESENAKLDVNLATPEMLASLPGVGESLAARLVGERPAAGYHSVEALFGVEGVSLAGLISSGDAGSTLGDSGVEDAERALAGEVALPLASMLTVWSFDPNVQGADTGAVGARRITLPAAWSDELDRALERRIEREATDALRALAASDEAPASVAGLVGALRRSGAPVSAWGVILDTFAVTDATHTRGLVDLNRAPAPVLAAVPGLDDESAQAIVDARDRFALDSRGTIAWIVERDLVTPEAFEQAAGWLTTRSTQWRVRVEGGFEPVTPGAESLGDGEGAADGLDLGAISASDEAGLLDRVVLEAVVDVSTRRPRLAALREITGREYVLASALARERQLDAAPEESPGDTERDSLIGLDPLDEGSVPPDPPPLVAPRARDRSTSAQGDAPQDPDPEADRGASTGRSGRWGTQP